MIQIFNNKLKTNTLSEINEENIYNVKNENIFGALKQSKKDEEIEELKNKSCRVKK